MENSNKLLPINGTKLKISNLNNMDNIRYILSLNFGSMGYIVDIFIQNLEEVELNIIILEWLSLLSTQ